MTSKRHKKQDIGGSKEDNPILNNNAGASQPFCSSGLEGKRTHSLVNVLATLPRVHRQLSLSRSNSLFDSSANDSHRKLLVIIKQDYESFGFEIQTYKLQHQNTHALEVCTYVCKVHEDSPSSYAGLKMGDMLTNINGINTEGFSHKQTVDLIKSSGNHLKLEAINGLNIRRSELEARLLFLKQNFHEKWAELQTIFRKENQLIYGEVKEGLVQEELDSLRSGLLETQTLSSSSFLNKHRYSSGSSYKSCLSFMTDASEDGFSHMSVFDEDSGSEMFSRQSSTDDDCFLLKANGHLAKKCSSSRHRSISMASSGSEPISPNWDTISLSNFFGTLPRKSRKGSMRKNFLKFIPGLHRSVEEEESPV
ncbi:cytohesin-interacting protein [Pelodytes ibericus]